MTELKGAVDVCMYCEASGLDCRCGSSEPCMICGFLTCRCRPAPCCGMCWSPIDFRLKDECGWCGAPIRRWYDPMVNALHVRITKVDGTHVEVAIPGV